MVAVGRNLCLFSAHTEDALILQQCGLRLVIPGVVITPIESVYEVSTQGLWGLGKLEFPEGSTIISGVCYISVSSSSELNKPFTVELMHCAHITNERQTEYSSFVSANSAPRFKFEYLPGGSFSSKSNYSAISLNQFSLLSIVLVISRAADTVGGVALGAVGVLVAGGGLAAAAIGHHGHHVESVMEKINRLLLNFCQHNQVTSSLLIVIIKLMSSI